MMMDPGAACLLKRSRGGLCLSGVIGEHLQALSWSSSDRFRGISQQAGVCGGSGSSSKMSSSSTLGICDEASLKVTTR